MNKELEGFVRDISFRNRLSERLDGYIKSNEVRVSEMGYISVFDVLKLFLGCKHGRHAYNSYSKRYPVLFSVFVKRSFCLNNSRQIFSTYCGKREEILDMLEYLFLDSRIFLESVDRINTVEAVKARLEVMKDRGYKSNSLDLLRGVSGLLSDISEDDFKDMLNDK